ncbi:unnamed protein product [Owenia fusiformis]|uniref:Uncharacterized protein n=1 Tax=Owenia fusiformis TaxID=6347 RepID=A0A8S4NIT7_OWEFU|nr:unnamed protein product [Owenia fusiformis]
MKGMRDKSGNPLPNAHLIGLFNRVCKLLFYQIKPIFVFDGGVPALKRQTMAARRLTKEVANRASSKTSEKILKNYMKSQAIRTIMAETGQEQTAPMLPPTSQNAPADIYDLPPLPDSIDGEDDMDYDWSDRHERLKEIEKEYQNIEAIDVESEEFKDMPPEVQHEVLMEIRQRRKENYEVQGDLPEDANDFSSFQITKLLKQNKLSSKIEDLRKEMNLKSVGAAPLNFDFGDEVESNRVMSEDAAHYVLIKGLKNAPQSIYDMVDEEGRTLNINVAKERLLELKAGSLPFSEYVENKKETVENESLEKSEPDIIEDISFEETETGYEKSTKSGLTPWKVKKSKPIKQNEISATNDVQTLNSTLNTYNTENKEITKNVITIDDDEINENANRVETLKEENMEMDFSTAGGFIPESDSEHEDNMSGGFINDTDNEPNEITNDVNAEAQNNIDSAQEKSNKTPIKADANDAATQARLDILSALKKQVETLKAGNIETKFDEPLDNAECKAEENLPISRSSPQYIQLELPDEESNSYDANNKDNPKVKQETVEIDDVRSAKSHIEQRNDARVGNPERNDFIQLDIPDADIHDYVQNIPKYGIDIENQSEMLIGQDSKTDSVHPNDTATPTSSQSVIKTTSNDDRKRALTDDESAGNLPKRSKMPNSTDSSSDTEKSMVINIDLGTSSQPDVDLFPVSLFTTSEPHHTEEKSSSLKDITPLQGITNEDLGEMANDLYLENIDLEKKRSDQERVATSITDQMHQEAQDLLQLFGLPFIVSPMEAEAQCAYLDLTGQSNGSITDDSDIWLFGAKHVYKNFFNQNRHVELYRGVDIRSQLALTREDMISIALLCGSDYTPGLQGVGAVTAMEILAEFKMLTNEGGDVLRNFKDWWTEAQTQLRTPLESKIRSKLRRLTVTPGFPSDAVREAYIAPTVDDSKEKFTWDTPDLDLLRQYAKDKFRWPKGKVDEMLLPVIQKLNEKQTQKRINSYFQPGTIASIGIPQKLHSKRIKQVLHKLHGDFQPSPETNHDEEQSKKSAPKKAGKTQKKQTTKRKAPSKTRNPKKPRVENQGRIVERSNLSESSSESETETTDKSDKAKEPSIYVDDDDNEDQDEGQRSNNEACTENTSRWDYFKDMNLRKPNYKPPRNQKKHRVVKSTLGRIDFEKISQEENEDRKQKAAEILKKTRTDKNLRDKSSFKEDGITKAESIIKNKLKNKKRK